MADEKLSEEIRHKSRDEIDTDELADRVADLEARLDDSVPSSLHEELRQVMLGERRRAEQAERDLDELREVLKGNSSYIEQRREEVTKAAGATLTGYWVDIIADISRNAIELRAVRALLRWVIANPSRCIGNCCGELGAFTVYHAAADDEISEDGSGATAEALADALGLDWRKP